MVFPKIQILCTSPAQTNRPSLSTLVNSNHYVKRMNIRIMKIRLSYLLKLNVFNSIHLIKFNMDILQKFIKEL